MDFHTFTTLREACKRSGIPDDPEEFYKMVFADAVKMISKDRTKFEQTR